MKPSFANTESPEDYNDPFYQKYVEEPEIFCFKTGKLSLPTKTQAKKRRQGIELKYHLYFDVYQCPHCQQWHLTTVDKDTRKNKNGNQR